MFVFLPQVEFFAVCIEFAPPPTAELKAAGKKLAKGNATKPSSKQDGARGVATTTADAAAESVAAGGERSHLDEKVHHGDFGGKAGRKGIWRACLAESGKVGFGLVLVWLELTDCVCVFRVCMRCEGRRWGREGSRLSVDGALVYFAGHSVGGGSVYLPLLGLFRCGEVERSIGCGVVARRFVGLHGGCTMQPILGYGRGPPRCVSAALLIEFAADLSRLYQVNFNCMLCIFTDVTPPLPALAGGLCRAGDHGG